MPRAPWPPSNVEVVTDIQDPYIRPEDRLEEPVVEPEPEPEGEG